MFVVTEFIITEFDCISKFSFILTEKTKKHFQPNLRGLKDREKINKILDEFETVDEIYKERYKIERCFAWEDTYRKLVTRYEKRQDTFMGFRYLAYSMINFRWVLGKIRMG